MPATLPTERFEHPSKQVIKGVPTVHSTDSIHASLGRHMPRLLLRLESTMYPACPGRTSHTRPYILSCTCIHPSSSLEACIGVPISWHVQPIGPMVHQACYPAAKLGAAPPPGADHDSAASPFCR